MTEEVVAGYKITDTRGLYGMSVPDYDKAVQAAHRALLEKEVNFAKYKNMSAEVIRNMSMNEYAKLRSETQPNYGVSTNIGGPPVFGNTYRTTAQSTPFEKWKNAREQFIAGVITDIELVLRYVRDEDSDRYTALVDLEIKEERAAKEVTNSGVPKHRFRWCRWPSWRWLASWLHR